ncbi:unnamed protein product [Phaedon cochleariae]|uniref:Uncharacterized protein n=1 Tax=Phaedon cochleariae TaxID=80249 RepID=A0A9N9SI47_PHACE|nr:unnamed protein product [Phaedon cochleariae]
MTDNDLEQLATFMGHTTGVHKNLYRLPNDVYQTAEVSKLLLLMDKGNASEFKEKALDGKEIDIEDLFEEKEDFVESDEELHRFNEDSGMNNEAGPIEIETAINDSPKTTSKKFKRILIPWTVEQKEIVRELFKDNIEKKIPPKR